MKNLMINDLGQKKLRFNIKRDALSLDSYKRLPEKPLFFETKIISERKK